MIDVPVEVKDALREGRLKKNYSITPVNDAGSPIGSILTNDNLVSESVILDERMCSGDVLKFGLCEGASIEFRYFNTTYVYPIKVGTRLKIAINVDYGPEYYPIQMGFFTVQSISRQASTGIIKVIAYNKLQSKYLDTKANQYLIDAYNSLSASGMVAGNITLDEVLAYTLSEYTIPNRFPANVIDYPNSNLAYTWDTFSYTGQRIPGDTRTIYGFNLYFHFHADGKLVKYPSDDTPEVIKNPIKFYIEKLHDFCDYVANFHVGVRNYYFDTDGNYRFAIHFRKSDGTEQNVNLTPLSADNFESALFSEYRAGSRSGYYVQGADFYFYISVPFNTTSSIYPGDIDTVVALLQESVSAECTPYTDLGGITIDNSVETWPDVTLRDLQTAVYETVAQFGQLDRKTDLFEGVELNGSRLLPRTTLYPSDDPNPLYPGGAVASLFKNSYSKLWADSGNVHKWKYLIITYKKLDGEGNEVEATLQRTVNNNGTDNYNCSDNWLFRNLVWTAEQIGAYADAMVAKMRDITWFPFEMWCAGLPYLETGDEIEIPLGNQTYTSYILQRQLKGIQNLQDTYINGTLDIF